MNSTGLNSARTGPWPGNRARTCPLAGQIAQRTPTIRKTIKESLRTIHMSHWRLRIHPWVSISSPTHALAMARSPADHLLIVTCHKWWWRSKPSIRSPSLSSSESRSCFNRANSTRSSLAHDNGATRGRTEVFSTIQHGLVQSIKPTSNRRLKGC
jgi:hypothetical protein